jgi:hypothetical protein
VLFLDRPPLRARRRLHDLATAAQGYPTMWPLNIKRFLVRTYRMRAAVDILFIRTDIIVKILFARTILSGAIGTGFDLDQVADTSV